MAGAFYFSAGFIIADLGSGVGAADLEVLLRCARSGGGVKAGG
jgi:hypothetical protein